MLINHNINNMAGGVSQQPVESRYDNQVEKMENFMITTANGLRRRNPVENVGSTSNNHANNMARHSYDRGDGLEKYGMTLTDNGLEVFDKDGNAKTVNEVNVSGTGLPLTEWAGSNWKKDIRFLTVGDTTFLLNKNVTVATTGELSPSINPRANAFYWLKRSFNDGAGGGYSYSVVINGTTYTASGTDTETVCKNISDQINNQYASDPTILPDYIRSVAIGSVMQVYVAEIHAPGFRTKTGFTDATLVTPKTSTNNFVRVRDENGTVLGLSVLDFETSFKLILGEYELYCDIGGVIDYYNLVNEAPTTFGTPYYSNSSQAKSNTSPDYVYMSLSLTNGTEDFTFSWSDSWGDQASYGWKGTTAKISDLPASLSGYSRKAVGTIAITGTDRDSFNNYYLVWDSDHWSESIAEGLENKLLAKTLPAKLVRESNGTFTLSFIDSWKSRLVGDDNSNPLASFVGGTISNMFFFKNRLCFTSDENTIMSEAGDYFNFFATTVLEVLDSDPIDASVDSNTVSLIRNVNVTGGAVTLWADNAQFLLAGTDILSPATTRISQTSSYQSYNGLSPIVVDNEVLFFNKIGTYLDVLSYAPATYQNDSTSAESIASHVPRYIPSTIESVAVSSSHNLVFLKDSQNANVIYVYKYYIQAGKKVVSAWSKWLFADEIKEIDVIEDTLYLYANTNSILKVELQPKDLTATFLDSGVTPYVSTVIMSPYNVETRQGTKTIREPFYIKNIKVNTEGSVDLDIINDERQSTKTVLTKHIELGRRLFIGGNSEFVKIGFSTNYSNGCEIDTLSIEGMLKLKSRNV